MPDRAPSVVRMTTGRPRRVVPRVPPEDSYSSTWSRTHFWGLGWYSPCRGMSVTTRHTGSLCLLGGQGLEVLVQFRHAEPRTGLERRRADLPPQPRHPEPVEDEVGVDQAARGERADRLAERQDDGHRVVVDRGGLW